MKNLCVWFEIPVLDMDRARAFYEKLLDVSINVGQMSDTLMGFFPMEGWDATGALTKHPQMKPSQDGIVIYLNAGEDLQPVQDRVEPAGGKIVMHKCEIGGDNGYMALFIDTEGNKIGLWSPK